jgi:serpin B
MLDVAAGIRRQSPPPAHVAHGAGHSVATHTVSATGFVALAETSDGSDGTSDDTDRAHEACSVSVTAAMARTRGTCPRPAAPRSTRPSDVGTQDANVRRQRHASCNDPICRARLAPMTSPNIPRHDWTRRAQSVLALLCAIVVLGFMACGPSTPVVVDEAPPGQSVRSGKPRLTTPVPAEDTQELTGDNAAFALDVLKRAAAHDNFFVSPHSISIALAMTYGGAREGTAAQMAQALHFTLPQERLHPAFDALDLELTHRADKPLESGQAFKLNVLNAIWGQRGYAFLATYLDLLAEDYGAGLSLLDFASDPDGSRTTINRWVSDRTLARIPELIPRGVITSATVLVLTNAIYFNASWKVPFEANDTTDGSFGQLDGSRAPVRLMHQTKEHRYAEGEGWQALELLYSGADVSMLVLLPASGTFEDFRAKLDAARLSSIVRALGTKEVVVTLPRFQFRTQLAVKATLTALGMVDAFQGGMADFSGIDGTRSLFIQDVVHETFVAVDERGTEAAAATAVVIGRTSISELATFTADRPFLVVLRDDPTGAVLFLGQITRP